MSPVSSAAANDPLLVLREYRQLAPWSLRDLATLSGAILDASGIRPINAAAAAYPNERTIRFYVPRGLVTPPEGRGTAAVYSYRHLLQVLGIKLRKLEGATRATITRELAEQTGDVLERRVAATIGPGLPPPSRLPLTAKDAAPRGRSGRALKAWLGEPEHAAPCHADRLRLRARLRARLRDQPARRPTWPPPPPATAAARDRPAHLGRSPPGRRTQAPRRHRRRPRGAG